MTIKKDGPVTVLDVRVGPFKTGEVVEGIHGALYVILETFPECCTVKIFPAYDEGVVYRDCSYTLFKRCPIKKLVSELISNFMTGNSLSKRM